MKIGTVRWFNLEKGRPEPVSASRSLRDVTEQDPSVLCRSSTGPLGLFQGRLEGRPLAHIQEDE